MDHTVIPVPLHPPPASAFSVLCHLYVLSFEEPSASLRGISPPSVPLSLPVVRHFLLSRRGRACSPFDGTRFEWNGETPRLVALVMFLLFGDAPHRVVNAPLLPSPEPARKCRRRPSRYRCRYLRDYPLSASSVSHSCPVSSSFRFFLFFVTEHLNYSPARSPSFRLLSLHPSVSSSLFFDWLFLCRSLCDL